MKHQFTQASTCFVWVVQTCQGPVLGPDVHGAAVDVEFTRPYCGHRILYLDYADGIHVVYQKN